MSWVAGIFELVGLWLVGNKNRIGFLFNIIGCIIWVYVAIVNFKLVGGLLIVVIPALLINTRNYIKWGKNAK